MRPDVLPLSLAALLAAGTGDGLGNVHPTDRPPTSPPGSIADRIRMSHHVRQVQIGEGFVWILDEITTNTSRNFVERLDSGAPISYPIT